MNNDITGEGWLARRQRGGVRALAAKRLSVVLVLDHALHCDARRQQ